MIPAPPITAHGPLVTSAPSSPSAPAPSGSATTGAKLRQRTVGPPAVPAHALHDHALYEAVRKARPDSAAVDSIKFDHRAHGVNIAPTETDDPANREPSVDEQIRRIHQTSEQWQRDTLASASDSAQRSGGGDGAGGGLVAMTDAGTALRLRELEACLARVDAHFGMVDAVEKEYREAEGRRFATEMAELAARTAKRLENARQAVRLADDSAARRERETQFLDRETAVAECVFLECMRRQTLRKEEEGRRVEVFRSALEHSHYLLGVADLRRVVKEAWVDGVSNTEEWKKWADVLSADHGLPNVTGLKRGASFKAASPIK